MAVAATDLSALEIQGVSVPGRLADVTLRLPRGTLAGLIGPNGSGKSTLLQAAAGLLPAEGSVSWSNRKIGEVPIVERGRLTSWVPQEARFEFGFSVRSVVAQGRFAHGDDERGIDDVLAKFDLTGLALRPVNRLSGGEKQRVLLARAFATAAPLQLWDEPLAQLDPRHVLEVLRLAEDYTRRGNTLLFSLHDLRTAYRLDWVIVLQEGRLRAAGVPTQVLTPELLHSVFGIQVRTADGLVLELPQRPMQ